VTTPNQNPEQIARDQIDKSLGEAGWIVQDKKAIDFSAGLGIAVREYQTDAGPADYVLFVDRRAVGVIEAKPKDCGQKITTVEEQSAGYAAAKLKWVNNKEPLPFVYESTGVITRFTDGRDPKPRSREVFTFHRPETMAEWLSKPKSLRARLHDIPALNPAGLRDCQITAIQNLEQSFRGDRPRALIQMATGSGKTFTAITSVNVGNEIYIIDTEVTRKGGKIKADQQIEKRERLTRKKRWERQDEEEQYAATQLDRAVVNPDQIRMVIRTFRDKLPDIFPGRKEVPKTLVFAKTDTAQTSITP
jgi:type I site-specific restriction endonuclease